MRYGADCEGIGNAKKGMAYGGARYLLCCSQSDELGQEGIRRTIRYLLPLL